MKLSRRCFLSFVIGGATGTALSPLPWKLVDDSSIWSQTWPWVPVPVDGETTYVDTTCTLCSGNCGIRVRKVDDRAIKIEGQEGSPLNVEGGVCLLGLSGLQLLYGPNRIQGPLKRVGKRGQGEWQPITWQQAIAEVADKLGAIRTQGKAQEVACLMPTADGTVSHLFKRFMTAFGSPNFINMPSVEDAYSAVLSLTQNTDGSLGLDIEDSDCVLSFGSALLDGFGSPLRMMQAVARLKTQHGTLIQVEPRLSNTAAKADIWIPAKPGTEADVALAMAYVIVAEKRFNADFVNADTEGFKALTAMLKEGYSPEAVAQRSGIKPEIIIKAALAFAKAKKPIAIFGRGKGQTPGSLKEALAVYTLNILAGNINQPGGVKVLPTYDYIDWPDVHTDTIAESGLKQQRLDGAGSKDAPYARNCVHRLIDVIHSGSSSLQALLVGEANPCYSLPDSTKVKEAFGKIPLVISFSSFMDETAANADLILPNHIYLERYEDVPVGSPSAHLAVGLCRPVVKPQHDTQHSGDSIIQIAHALKGSVARAFPWSDYFSCLKETLDLQWNALLQQGVWMPEDNAPPNVNTSSGKLVLMNDNLEKIYRANTPMPEGDLLLVPYDTIRLSSNYIGATPFMTKIVPDTVLKRQKGFVHVNPKTADHLGIEEGDTATLKTKIGSAQVLVHCDDGLMPGLIAMARGLGHTAYDGFLADKGVNINTIIGPVEDPASGLDAAWAIAAELTKA